VKRSQGVCGPEQACERERIAPQSSVVGEADRVPLQGRQHPHTRDRVSACWRFRGADPQHADQGTFVDWGDPTASEAAHGLHRSRRGKRAQRKPVVTRGRQSDGPRGLGARESRGQGEGVRSVCPWKGTPGPYPGRARPAGPRARPAAPRGNNTGQDPSKSSQGTAAHVSLVSAPPPPREAARPSQPEGQGQGGGPRWRSRCRGHRDPGLARAGGPAAEPYPRISSAARAARVETETGQSGAAPHRDADRARPRPPDKRRAGARSPRGTRVSHRLVWWEARTECPPRPGDTDRNQRREESPRGSGGGPPGCLRPSGPGVGAAVRATAGWGSPVADAHPSVAQSGSDEARGHGGGRDAGYAPRGQ
jgi:hypothetical protein